MTQPTGRPRGRPKTKEYSTLMARVPQELRDRVKRYAAAHRQPMSVVIRDALILLMEEYPSRADLSPSHRLAAHEFLSDRYESELDTLLGEADSAGLEELLSDTNEEMLETVLEGTNSRTDSVSNTKEAMADIASDRNRERAAIRMETPVRSQSRKVSGRKADPSAIQSDSKSGRFSLLSDTNVPAFDAGKYVLGKLCPRGHDYHGTGQSLRHLRRHGCGACEAEQAQARRKARRTA
jgi:hypothetical protein